MMYIPLGFLSGSVALAIAIACSSIISFDVLQCVCDHHNIHKHVVRTAEIYQ
jgi:hypothetical protein